MVFLFRYIESLPVRRICCINTRGWVARPVVVRSFTSSGVLPFKTDSLAKVSETARVRIEDEEDPAFKAIEWQKHTDTSRLAQRQRVHQQRREQPILDDHAFQTELIERIRHLDSKKLPEAYELTIRFMRECDVHRAPAEYLEVVLSVLFKYLDYDGFERLLSVYIGSTKELSPSVVQAALKIYFKRQEFDMAKAFFHQYVIIAEIASPSVLYVYLKSALRKNCVISVYLSAYRLWTSKGFEVSLPIQCLLAEVIEMKGSNVDKEWLGEELERMITLSERTAVEAVADLKKSLLQTPLLDKKLKVVDAKRQALKSVESDVHVGYFYGLLYDKSLKHFASFGNMQYLREVISRFQQDRKADSQIIASRVSVYYALNEKPSQLVQFLQTCATKGLKFSPRFFHRYCDSLYYSFPDSYDELMGDIRNFLGQLNDPWAQTVLHQIKVINKEHKPEALHGVTYDETTKRGRRQAALARLEQSALRGTAPKSSSMKQVVKVLHPSDYDGITRLSKMVEATLDTKLIKSTQIAQLEKAVLNMALQTRKLRGAKDKLRKYIEENWDTLAAAEMIQLAWIALKVRDYAFAIRLGDHAFDKVVVMRSQLDSFNAADAPSAYCILLNAHLRSGHYEKYLTLLDLMEKDSNLAATPQLVAQLDKQKKWLVLHVDRGEDPQMKDIRRKIAGYVEGVTERLATRYRDELAHAKYSILEDVQFFQRWGAL